MYHTRRDIHNALGSFLPNHASAAQVAKRLGLDGDEDVASVKVALNDLCLTGCVNGARRRRGRGHEDVYKYIRDPSCAPKPRGCGDDTKLAAEPPRERPAVVVALGSDAADLRATLLEAAGRMQKAEQRLADIAAFLDGVRAVGLQSINCAAWDRVMVRVESIAKGAQ